MNTPYQTPNLDTSWEELKKTVQEQAELIRTLQAQTIQKKCECHIIDPAKMRILLWINRSKAGKPDTCVLKIAEQRLLGLPRSDRRGETYWRFDEIIEAPKETPPTAFKCSSCQEEVSVVGSDNYQEEIKQREALKKELARMEVKPQEASPEKPEEPKTEAKNPTRLELKEQIAKAMKENKASETKENAPA